MICATSVATAPSGLRGRLLSSTAGFRLSAVVRSNKPETTHRWLSRARQVARRLEMRLRVGMWCIPSPAGVRCGVGCGVFVAWLLTVQPFKLSVYFLTDQRQVRLTG